MVLEETGEKFLICFCHAYDSDTTYRKDETKATKCGQSFSWHINFSSALRALVSGPFLLQE
jgi:hypothetical protein